MNKEYNQMVKADKKARRDKPKAKGAKGKAKVVDKGERDEKAPDLDSVVESP